MSTSILKDFSIVSLGTIAAKLAYFCALPVLSRSFTPEDFTLLASFLSLATVISVAMCLRYDAAIMVAEKKDDVIALVVLSIIVSLIICFVSYLLTSLFYALFFDGDTRYSLLVYSPFAALFLSLFLIAQSINIRLGNFLRLTKIKFFQSLIGVIFLVMCAYVKPIALLLVVGNIMSNTLIGAFYSVSFFLNRIRTIRYVSLVKVSKKYINFPKYSTFEAISNIAGLQIPIFIISLLSGDQGGQLFLAMQVLFAPLTLVGQSLSQVYAKRAREHKELGTLSEFTDSILNKLLHFGVLPIVLVGVFIPAMFSFIFGSDWEGAGYYGAILIPWIIMQFIASPISSVMYINNKQREFLLITFIGMILRVVPTIVFAMFLSGYTVEVFIFSSTLFYILCFYSFSKSAGIKSNKINEIMLKILFVCLFGLVLLILNGV